MRRYSVLLGLAAVIIVAIVGYTYSLRVKKDDSARRIPPQMMQPGVEAKSDKGWEVRTS